MASVPKASTILEPAAEEDVRARVARLEKARGVEIVTAIVARADSYPEVPWKAFSLGASLMALAAAILALFDPGWDALSAVIETAIAVLAGGSVLALATIWITPFARLFIPAERREVEVRQYAQALFLENELYRTRRRDGILLLVGMLEHQVIVLADRGVAGKLAPDALNRVVAAVTEALTRKTLAEALLAGLQRLDEILEQHGFQAPAGDANEISDGVIQRQGPE